MANVFLSYKSQRRAAAKYFSKLMETQGYSVWYDYNLIKGKDFGVQLDRQIRTARVVVVLWCSLSVNSEWVQEEVDLAKSLEKLLPIKIEPCDLKLGTRRLDYIDLSDWEGDPKSGCLHEFFRHLRIRVGPSEPDESMIEALQREWRKEGSKKLREFPIEKTIPSSETFRITIDNNVGRSQDANLEVSYWESIRDTDDPGEIEGFLAQFPRSGFRTLALRRLDKLEWTRAFSAQDYRAMQKYIERYPEGIYRSEADRIVTEQLKKESDIIKSFITATNKSCSQLREDLESNGFHLLENDIAQLLTLWDEERYEVGFIRDTGDEEDWKTARDKRKAFEAVLLEKITKI
jgi:hypothetical protein